MTGETFEASTLWRVALGHAFALKERVIDVGDAEIILWKHPFYSRWISTPYRDRLAIRWHGEGASLTEDALRRLFARSGDIVLKDCEAFVTPDVLAGKPGINPRQEYTNSEVLLDDDFEQRMNRSARKNWRRATEEYGLTIEVNPSGRFEEFYDIYLSTRRRLGVPPYRQNLFRLLFDHMGGEVILFRCHGARQSYGYLVCYAHGSEIISAHIGYLFEHREKRIADFLFMSAFRWGVENGYHLYRFGGDHNNQESLIAAKKKLGAVARPQFDVASVARPAEADDPESLVRRTLRAMPRAAFRHAGLLTMLYFR
jgi:hypothetical protein